MQVVRFTDVFSQIVVLELDNIDTEMTVSKQSLTRLKKSRPGNALVYKMRYDKQDDITHACTSSTAKVYFSKILITRSNFCCWQNGYHATCVIRSNEISSIMLQFFSDIFINNCVKGDIFLIVLLKEDYIVLQKYIKKYDTNLIIDMSLQTITLYNGKFIIKYAMLSDKKKMFLKKLDDINKTLQNSNSIDQFEYKNRNIRPWIYGESIN